MRVFITDLAAYNEGHLVGKWITLPMSKLKLHKVIRDVLREGERVSGTTGHEEIFISDSEGDITVNAHDPLFELNKYVCAVQDLSDYDLLKLNFLQQEGFNQYEVLENGIDSYEVEIYDYRGTQSLSDTYELLAEDLIEDGVFGAIPVPLQSYIDTTAIARDLQFDFTEFETRVLGRILS